MENRGALRCQTCSQPGGHAVYISASDRWIVTRGPVRGGEWCRACAKGEAARKNTEARERETARHGPVTHKHV